MSNSDVSKQILIICSTVRICVLVTSQKQILTVDLSAVILSPVSYGIVWYGMVSYVVRLFFCKVREKIFYSSE